MPVVTAAIRQLLLAEQDPASVAQLAGPGAKLMAAIYLRQRRHARKQRFAAPDTGPAFRRKQGVGHPSCCASGALRQMSRALSNGVGDREV